MNNTNLIGRLVKDVDLKEGSTTVAKFTIAVNRRFKKNEADFINCVAFGKAAEIISQYISKGSQIGIEGHIQTGSYENNEGKRVYTFDVIVDSFDFVGSNKQENKQNNSFDDNLLGQALDDGDCPF